MSKRIAVTDKVYYQIRKYQGPRESYSHVLERALSVFETISEVGKTLGSAHYLKEKQERR